MPPADDETRWAEAQSLLERAPTPSAEERVRHWRRVRVASVLALGAAAAVAGLILFLLFDVGTAPESEPPPWQRVLGVVVQAVALVLAIVGLVVQVRGNRRLHVWRNALAPLTRAQRKELLATIRGRAPVEPERLPLARYTAALLEHQRTGITGQVGLVLLFAGQWVVSPTAWRLALVAVLSAVFGVAAVYLKRDVARVREFLDRHPAADGSAA